jgi:hypothetical protein
MSTIKLLCTYTYALPFFLGVGGWVKGDYMIPLVVKTRLDWQVEKKNSTRASSYAMMPVLEQLKMG